MPPDAPRPHSRGRLDVHLPGHMEKVLLERFEQTIFHLCLLFICCCLEDIVAQTYVTHKKNDVSRQ